MKRTKNFSWEKSSHAIYDYLEGMFCCKKCPYSTIAASLRFTSLVGSDRQKVLLFGIKIIFYSFLSLEKVVLLAKCQLLGNIRIV